MRRRTLLGTTAGLAGLAGLAGCSADLDAAQGTRPTDEDYDAQARVNVDALPVDPDDAVTTFTVRWSKLTTLILDPDGADARQAANGGRFLVFDLAVTNIGDAAARMRPAAFQVADLDKRRYPQADVADPDSLRTRRLDPGETARGWLPFTIDKGNIKYLFALSNDALPDPVTVAFEYDEDLASHYQDGGTMTTVPGETVTTREPTESPTPTVTGEE